MSYYSILNDFSFLVLYWMWLFYWRLSTEHISGLCIICLCITRILTSFFFLLFSFCVHGLFAVVDDIFCLFQGHIENIAVLKQQYGLNKTANEGIIVIEAYRTLRDRGPYPPDQVVRDIQGKFAFIIYDSSSKTTFIASVSKPNVSQCNG